MSDNSRAPVPSRVSLSLTVFWSCARSPSPVENATLIYPIDEKPLLVLLVRIILDITIYNLI
jgi:hypothetical protein